MGDEMNQEEIDRQSKGTLRSSLASRLSRLSRAAIAKSEVSLCNVSPRLNTVSRIKLRDKVEFLMTEIRIHKQEIHQEVTATERRKRRLLYTTEERHEELKDLAALKTKFRIFSEERGKILSDQPRTNEVRYDAQVLRRFHRDYKKALETKEDILMLSNQNIRRFHVRVDDLVQRKRETQGSLTQNDVEIVEVYADELGKENATLDSELKKTHKTQNEAIFNHRKAEKSLCKWEREKGKMKKDQTDRQEMIKKMEETKLLLEKEIQALEKENVHQTTMKETYKRPNTIKYVQVTLKNKKLRQEINAMKVKLTLAKLNYNNTQTRLRELLEKTQGKEEAERILRNMRQSGDTKKWGESKLKLVQSTVTLPPI